MEEVNQVVATVLFACLALSSIGTATSASDSCSCSAEKAAITMKGTLDEYVDPCHDFNKFACGNFDITLNSIPYGVRYYIGQLEQGEEEIFKQGKPLMNQLNDARSFETDKKIRKVYRACMDVDEQDRLGLEPMNQLVLEPLGGWPVVRGPSWTPSKTWVDVMLGVNELGLHHTHFMEIQGETGNLDVDNFLRLSFPRVPVEFSHARANRTQSYQDYMVKAAVLFGASKSYARTEMKKVYEFEHQLWQIPGDTHFEMVRYPLSALERLFSSTGLSIKKFLQTFFGTGSQDKGLRGTDVAFITGMQHFEKAADLFKVTENRTLVNYVIWRAVSSKMASLGENARTIADNYNPALWHKPQRWKECLKLAGFNDRRASECAGAGLAVAASSLYVRRHFKQSDRKAAKAIFETVQDSLREVINSSTWMKGTMNKKSRSRLENMNLIVGPDELYQKDKVDNLFEDLSGISSTQHLKNELEIAKFASKQHYRILADGISASHWSCGLKAAAVPAFGFDYRTNSTVIMAGQLAGNIFNLKVPQYINFPKLGYELGNVMSGAFVFNEKGEKENLLRETEYDSTLECFEDQYNKTQVPALPAFVKLNGYSHKQDVFAQNSGLSVAYKAYEKYVATMLDGQQENRLPGLEKYTPQQMFWISYGQLMCATYRKEGLIRASDGLDDFLFNVRARHLRNHKKFAQDFNCPLGTEMNPMKKCLLW